MTLPNLAAFWRNHPGTVITLHPTRDFVDILQDGYDPAIRAVFEGQVKPNPGGDARHLHDVHLVGAASPDLSERSGKDAHDLPWLWHEQNETKLVLMHASGMRMDRMDWVSIGGLNLQLKALM